MIPHPGGPVIQSECSLVRTSNQRFLYCNQTLNCLVNPGIFFLTNVVTIPHYFPLLFFFFDFLLVICLNIYLLNQMTAVYNGRTIDNKTFQIVRTMHIHLAPTFACGCSRESLCSRLHRQVSSVFRSLVYCALPVS